MLPESPTANTVTVGLGVLGECVGGKVGSPVGLGLGRDRCADAGCRVGRGVGFVGALVGIGVGICITSAGSNPPLVAPVSSLIFSRCSPSSH